MRPRTAAAISLLAATSAIAAPALATAHPVHNRGLTIAATPNPIASGENVLIYGAMHGVNDANQTVQLYHHLPGTPGFQYVSSATTNAAGFYEFPSADGSVTTNRDWFVRGPGDIHSRTMHEHVQAVVTMSASATTATTQQPITFTGSISPDSAGTVIKLQKQLNDGAWATITDSQVASDGTFSLTKTFRHANTYQLRALFPGDRFNDRGYSDSSTLTVEQKQVPGFSINTSAQIIPFGQSATISGVLDQPGTSTPEANTEVTLFGRTHGGPEQALATVATGADGSYSFPNLTPQTNTAYRVITTLKPRLSTAVLFEGIADTISLSATPTTVPIGAPVTFSGNVTPNNAGEVVFLQRQNANGVWVNVDASTIAPDGTYSFTRGFGAMGTFTFRTRVYGDGYNVGAGSAPVAITVSGLPPATSLPPAS